MPLKRLLRNIFRGHLLGLLHIRSHQTHEGKPKVMYNTKATAIKSAASMSKKTGNYFSNYKCIYCDGYHIGKHHTNTVP